MTSTSISSGFERPAKKLRSSEPDCKVTLKWRGRDGAHEECFQYHSVILANISTIADNAFENDDGVKEMIFHVRPREFREAMKFVEDPQEARKMKVHHVNDVVGFYHKYDFSGGLRLCDQVLKEYFGRCQKEKTTEFVSNEFDSLIDNVLMAEKYHLQEAFKVGVAFLQEKLHSMAAPFGCTMFTEEHAKELQDLFVRGTLKCPGISKQEELESDMFPRLMVLSLQNYFMTCRVPQLTVSGTDSKADGKYKHNLLNDQYEAMDGRKGHIDGDEVQFFIHKSDSYDAWVISCRQVDDEDQEDMGLWWCPHSYNLPYPPTGPWYYDMGDKEKVVQIAYSKMRY